MTILLPILIVAGIGLVAGVGLAVAAAVLHVPVNEQVEQLLKALPGANCGACGYTGCAGYAEAMAGSGAPANLCIPGGASTAAALAGVLGVEAETVAEKRAFVRCNGTTANCKLSHEYRGEQSCAASSLLFSGQKQCNYGCLGFGDCARVCPEDAISFRDGVAVVDPQVCIGCAACVKACPKKIIVLEETRGRAVNRCSSKAPGAVSRKQCSVSCLGCRLCERNCPEKAVTVENNLAYVDMARCTGCGLCISKCPTKCLQMFLPSVPQ
ncbi:MAG: RnfABCDGE type electron transport complex subunit B [Oscillospiraceae bacterium]|jgi:RnfABCDGE-type electron transport complex B subunit|nr:RnfABCDGE type electron transport complex subunit B [Oscillospiraceae bacterium]